MPKFRQTSEILRLMHQKEHIRNVGLIAHIDHGKTTLTDSLLIEAGLLPSQVEGSVRVLDYLEEEQRRGITIKTANISFLHRSGKETYLINLVDTPGHVDFIGKVARALRAIDGAIVVVDSVEEVMAQTETVTRQALEERVKPVLFINKVDRLMQELRLTADELQTKFIHIINDFNNIIEIYGEPEFKRKWKVDPARGSVVFGSALHRWGFTVEEAKVRKIRFDDSTAMEKYRKGDFKRLSQIVPLQDAILEMVVRNIPSPLESQKYRIPKIWKGSSTSEVREAMVNCDDEGPLAMCVTAVKSFPDEGVVATGRVFSGALRPGQKIYCVNVKEESQLQGISFYMSSFRESANEIPAGNIAAVEGLQHVRAGETVIDSEHMESKTVFEGFRQIPLPVVTVAVEPANPRDLDGLLMALEKLEIEDPDIRASVNRETGQCLIGGLGELHLEVALNFLKQQNVEIELKIANPVASYREAASNVGSLVAAKSPNRLNEVWVQVRPLEETTVELIEKIGTFSIDALKARVFRSAKEKIRAFDDQANILLDSIEDKNLSETVSGDLISGFEWACRNGPLCGQPLRGSEISVVKTIVDPNPRNRGPGQIERAVSRAILGSFLTAMPILLEPIFRIAVSVPIDWLGACSNLIRRRHGRITSTEQRGVSVDITGYIPVAETLGLSKEMRSVTSGHAFWELVFDHWDRIPSERSNATIGGLRRNKGLPSDIPKPETFVDDICPAKRKIV